MIRIKLNQPEYKRVMKALKSVRHRINWWIKADGGELNRRCAIGYAQVLVRNIMSTGYPIPPYSERYAKWKKKYGKKGYPATWQLFGDLVKNIANFKSGIGWMGGIQAGIFDSGGKSWLGKGDKGRPKRIAMYAAVNERKRPIFRPTMEEYADTDWLKQAGLAMKNIERSWK
ncbi:unnamed protein product [marine sediment metagenome]|uniref:Uncharacterized protein n=1 Tax=marine sediment metagenome TaxID=412755 RepID=X0SI17_9ZZZZ